MAIASFVGHYGVVFSDVSGRFFLQPLWVKLPHAVNQ